MPGTLIVSLDFELFWGMLDCSTLEAYQDNVLGGRKAIPQLLKLFQKYDIHATWATVGYLFAENYGELSRYFPEQALCPSYADEKLDPYVWFAKIGKNEEEAPCFYAPSGFGNTGTGDRQPYLLSLLLQGKGPDSRTVCR